MDRIIDRCAGLDVHKDSVTACVRVPGERGERHQETRTFSTTTRGLLTLRDWLASFGDPDRDGVDGGVLEAGVLPARGRLRVLAAQRPPPQGRPRLTSIRASGSSRSCGSGPSSRPRGASRSLERLV